MGLADTLAVDEDLGMPFPFRSLALAGEDLVPPVAELREDLFDLLDLLFRLVPSILYFSRCGC
jgi:hypothetical protein